MPILQNYTGIPVVGVIAANEIARKMLGAMNSIKRLILGVFSTLLLAAGLARAADRLDPMSHSLRPSAGDVVVSDGPVPPCTLPCLDGGGDDGTK